jgi:hypothetical protein
VLQLTFWVELATVSGDDLRLNAAHDHVKIYNILFSTVFVFWQWKMIMMG